MSVAHITGIHCCYVCCSPVTTHTNVTAVLYQAHQGSSALHTVSSSKRLWPITRPILLVLCANFPPNYAKYVVPLMPNMLSLFLATSSVLPSTATGTMTGGKAHHHSWQLSPPSRAGWAGEQGRSCAGARAQRCCSLYQKKCWGCNGACSVVQGSRGALVQGVQEEEKLCS